MMPCNAIFDFSEVVSGFGHGIFLQIFDLSRGRRVAQ